MLQTPEDHRPPEDEHHESGTGSRKIATRALRPRYVLLQRNLAIFTMTGYQHLALTFGTLLSSQGTDASFGSLSGSSRR
ncbi:hypothetical protein PJ985_22975, partial [Streptomyces sp. ACA25]|uniref:hypothetical protein n=1 Tax=Streptomyces sp. ACA25 TaxID=3022596 RepID=UPI0023078F2B